MISPRPGPFTMWLDEIDRTQLALVGGKGANLGELARLDGIRVPDGFCVTTTAYGCAVATASIHDLLDRISRAGPADTGTFRSLGAEIREAIQNTEIPGDVASAITAALARLDDRAGYAIRSSATAEDLPSTSFAGQHDSYLNVLGAAAILERVRRCWASLFTERAVAYRARNGIDHRGVRMAVIVQAMVAAEASGVVFTADPATSNRKVTTIESTLGLGEALVSGRVNADVHRVRDDEIIAATIGVKPVAVHAASAGGTRERPVAADHQRRPALSDRHVLELARLARRVEAHFGSPQDIEWCLAGDELHLVQSRPITTLFPIPPADDDDNHVYVSVGHNQMMTDAMKPLGLSFWQMTTRAPMAEAGGRLFVDVTARLAAPASRRAMLDLFGRGDPLVRDALETIIARADFLPSERDDTAAGPLSEPFGAVPDPIETDPSIVTTLIEQTQASIEVARREIRDKTGTELLAFIVDDIKELQRCLSGRLSHLAAMAGMEATWWLNDHIAEWLGARDVVDTLTLSAPNNVTSEMGLALLDVADAIRPHPNVVAYLETVDRDDAFLDHLDDLDGGPAARAAIEGYLRRYGMRCVGEIDITRPRWAERPSALVATIVGNIHHFESGAGPRRFEQGRHRAAAAERDLLERLRALPDGDSKAAETQRMIERVRSFIGYREYPKYGMISRYYIYKRALSAEAGRLVDAGVLRARDDIFFLRFDELQGVIRAQAVDHALIDERKAAYRSFEALTPPRVLTSEGEAVTGSYRGDDLPDGALAGLPVSAGTVEGRARVLTTMADAALEPGDILVTKHTDPSWSPLFVTIGGLVTEAGGLMTHGAVVAREYGLPAVAGVEHATRRIRDGQRVRVDGAAGYVQLLADR